MYETLQPGDTGSDVQQLQQQLAGLGYPVSVTGEFDELTEQAVRGYQEYCGVEATGVADAGIRQQLEATAGYYQTEYPQWDGPGEAGQYPGYDGQPQDPYAWPEEPGQPGADQESAAGTCDCTVDDALAAAGGQLDEEDPELAGVLEEGEDPGEDSGADSGDLAGTDYPSELADADIELVGLQARRGRQGGSSTVPASCRANAKACFSISQRRAWLLRPGRVVVVAVPALGGRPGHPTPTGQFTVQFHDANHVSSIYHAPMPFYVNFAPQVGFHAGSLVVRSHGCVHLSRDNAQRFFSYLQDGDPVDVVP